MHHLTGVPIHLDLLVSHLVDGADQLIKLLVHRILSRVVLLFLLLVVDTDLVDLVGENVHCLSLNFNVGIHLAQVLDQVSELRPHLVLLPLTESPHPSLKLADLALPDVLVSANHLLLHNQHILVVLELFVHVQNPDKVSDHRDLFLGRSLNFHLLDTVECVAHDSDEQVHEQELSDECGEDEEHPN